MAWSSGLVIGMPQAIQFLAIDRPSRLRESRSILLGAFCVTRDTPASS
jgi:hypothetical protein